MDKPKVWVECATCGALVYADDEVCCVCHSPLDGNVRKPQPKIELEIEH